MRGWLPLYRLSVRLGLRHLLKRGAYTRQALIRVLIPLDPSRYLELPQTFAGLGARPGEQVLDLASPKLLAVALARRGAEVTSLDLSTARDRGLARAGRRQGAAPLRGGRRPRASVRRCDLRPRLQRLRARAHRGRRATSRRSASWRALCGRAVAYCSRCPMPSATERTGVTNRCTGAGARTERALLLRALVRRRAAGALLAAAPELRVSERRSRTHAAELAPAVPTLVSPG